VTDDDWQVPHRPEQTAVDALFRRLVEAAPDGIVAVDRAGRIVLANVQAELLFGFGPGDLVGQSVEALLPEDLRGLHAAHRGAYHADARIRTMGLGPELAGRRTDGTTFPAEIGLSPLATDAGPLVIGVVRDVTERKRTDSARALAAIVEASDDAIIGKTLDGIITSWNPAAERMYGWTAAEMVGQPISRLLPSERADDLPAILERMRRGERIDHFETVRMTNDGRRLDVSVSISPIADASGAVVGAAAIARDVTARKRAEATQGFLAEAGEVLASSLDYEATLATVARLTIPTLADFCTVFAVEPDAPLRWVAAAHTDPCKESLLRELATLYQPDPTRPDSVVGRVLRTGQPVLIPEIPTELVEALFPPIPRLRQILRELSDRSSMLVPLVARGQNLGVLTFTMAESGRRYGPADLSLAQDLARRAALAIDNARLHREVAERERRLQDLVGRLLAAQEEERRRVAYEVHDELAQVAAGTHQHLQAFADRYRPRSPEARAALDRALELARRTIREARRVVAGLRPTALDDFGLAVALRLLAEDLQGDGWDIACDEALGPERLPLAVETALYRVAQEALTNVRKHAGTTPVRVTLERSDRLVRLEVRDWGRGFAADAVEPGTGPGARVGLPGMRERIALLGGRCEVRSRPGGGTRVVVEVPLSRAAEAGRAPAS
jgi:PAS domain S-box-containing protein